MINFFFFTLGCNLLIVRSVLYHLCENTPKKKERLQNGPVIGWVATPCQSLCLSVDCVTLVQSIPANVQTLLHHSLPTSMFFPIQSKLFAQLVMSLRSQYISLWNEPLCQLKRVVTCICIAILVLSSFLCKFVHPSDGMSLTLSGLLSLSSVIRLWWSHHATIATDSLFRIQVTVGRGLKNTSLLEGED